ncbi:MAG: hypothetical protein GC136_05355 [Alphaproteobacteria bacterium]|nr:hypothetical protein [Alphaproteobacteria bacterium]
MNIWLFLWAFAAFFIVGIYIWTIRITIQQKAAWKKFAENHRMEYVPGRALGPAAVKGQYKEYGFVLYTEEQPTADVRGRRYRTVMELRLPGTMPTSGLIAAPFYIAFANTLDLPVTVTPEFEGWHEGTIVRTKDEEKLKSYLTPERLKVLNSLMATKTANPLLIFDERECYLRFETADPMTEDGLIEKIADKLATAANILKI